MTENRKTAVYIRLSMEDENVDGRTKLESDSVTSQRILLKSFVIDQLGVDVYKRQVYLSLNKITFVS